MTPATTSAAPPSHAVLQQAAQWYARLRDGRASAAERAAWRRWLDASEAHVAAWQRVEQVSRGLAPLQDVPDPRIAAERITAAGERLRTRRRILASVGVVAGGGLLGWLGWQETQLPVALLARRADLRTSVGERRHVTLADGSSLWLNTASAVDLRFDARQRRLVLRAGEILVQTAQDAARPFRVDTPQGRLRALGTRFDVRMDGAATQLAVYDGAVRIRTAANGTTAVLAAGQQAGFRADRIDPARAAAPAREAWAQGTLVADNLPLRAVIQELGRYRRGHLGVADEVAGLIVYGNFPLDDSDRALRMLASALPVRIAQPLPWWTRVEARR